MRGRGGGGRGVGGGGGGTSGNEDGKEKPRNEEFGHK